MTNPTINGVITERIVPMNDRNSGICNNAKYSTITALNDKNV